MIADRVTGWKHSPQAAGMPGKRLGLTLLEVLISIALIVLMMSVAVTFFWQTAEIRAQARASADRTQLARQALGQIAAELRGCLGMDQVGFPVEQRLKGDRRNLTLLTTELPAETQYRFLAQDETPPPAQHDLTEVSYSLAVDTENLDDDGEPTVNGIIRTEKQTLNQYVIEEDDPLQVRSEVWSPELKYLEFRYFDGVEWDIKWDVTEGNSLPQLVMITVGYEPITMQEYENTDIAGSELMQDPLGRDAEPREDRYTTIVKVPSADKLFRPRMQRVGQQVREQLGLEAAGP